MKKFVDDFRIVSKPFLTGCADDQARQQIADTNQRLNQIQQNVGVLDNKVSNQKCWICSIRLMTFKVRLTS